MDAYDDEAEISSCFDIIFSDEWTRLLNDNIMPIR